MRSIRGRGCAAAFVFGVLTLAGQAASEARADEGDREKALEERVLELERQLAELRARSHGGESSDLESRVADLEKLTKKDKDGLFAYWKTGIRLDSADKRFKFKIGGRVMNDYVMWNSDSDTETVVEDELNTGTEFRRARLYVAGTIYGNVDFKAQYDFAGGDAEFKDVYIRYRDLIPGTAITVGHHYVAFGLEEQTSSKYITFLERGLNTTFNPSRKTGISIAGTALDEELTWRGTAFRESDAFGDDDGSTNTGEGEWNFAGRVTYRPWVNEDGDEYLHVGGSIGMLNAARDSDGDEDIRFRQRPQVHQSPRFVNTDHIDVDDETMLYGLDAAVVLGPLHAQAEWARADVDAMGMSDPSFNAHDIQVGYFLTGEHRPYKGGNFSRIKPESIWGEEDGSGAVEVAVRYSDIDLDDEEVRGGKMNVWTFGLNWYLNPNTRIMINYNLIDLDRRAEDGTRADKVSAVQIRFQIDF
jgi:phosphate-selective porin OprO/OprP